MNSLSLYQWNLAQAASHSCSASESLVPETRPPSNTTRVLEEEYLRPKVDVLALAREFLTILHIRGVSREPSIPELMRMILGYREFTSEEIRDIIREMFPAHYGGGEGYNRLKENVKHNLSRCKKSFVRGPRTRGMSGKGGLWSLKQLAMPKVRKTASRSQARRSAAPSASIASPAHTDTTEISQVEESFSVPLGPSASSAGASWVASPGAETHSFTYPVYVPETSSTPEWSAFALFSENGQGRLTGDDVDSQQWISFPSTPVTGFGQAGLVQNAEAFQSFQYVPTTTPGSLHDADAWHQQIHPYSALHYGSPQFLS